MSEAKHHVKDGLPVTFIAVLSSIILYGTLSLSSAPKSLVLTTIPGSLSANVINVYNLPALIIDSDKNDANIGNITIAKAKY